MFKLLHEPVTDRVASTLADGKHVMLFGVPLDEESSKLCTLSTPFGMFK